MAVLYEWDAGTSSFRPKNCVIGDDGGKTAFLHIHGYYDTLELLRAAVPNPKAGDCYGIGTEAPYNYHVFDGVSGTWKPNGMLQGAQGVGITSIERTEGNGAPGTVDTYTITLTNGAKYTFTVSNGETANVIYTATIGTIWAGTAAPYSQAISVPGLLITDTPAVDIVQTGTEETDIVIRTSWAKITRIMTSADMITVYASEPIANNIPVQILCAR